MYLNQKFKFVCIVACIFILSACKPESKPIIYGEDKCDFCRMSIVDQRFGGEIVTQKGKTYKFDAVECLVNYIDKQVDDETKLKLILTNTYDQPGELINARECFYLKSENMPSPMGMFLNPFKDRAEAINQQKQNTGSIWNWEELRADFDKNK